MRDRIESQLLVSRARCHWARLPRAVPEAYELVRTLGGSSKRVSRHVAHCRPLGGVPVLSTIPARPVSAAAQPGEGYARAASVMPLRHFTYGKNSVPNPTPPVRERLQPLHVLSAARTDQPRRLLCLSAESAAAVAPVLRTSPNAAPPRRRARPPGTPPRSNRPRRTLDLAGMPGRQTGRPLSSYYRRHRE